MAATTEHALEVGKNTRFTSERQPENRRKPQVNIVEAVRELMEGDAWAIVDAELLDENSRPTGQMAKVRFKTPTVEIAARAWAAKVSKADPRLLELYLERTLGKVPQDFNLGGASGNAIEISVSKGMTLEEKRAILKLAKAKQQNE